MHEKRIFRVKDKLINTNELTVTKSILYKRKIAY